MINMNKVRITAIRQTVYPDLMAKYENPIEHTCDVREGQQFITPHAAPSLPEWQHHSLSMRQRGQTELHGSTSTSSDDASALGEDIVTVPKRVMEPEMEMA